MSNDEVFDDLLEKHPEVEGKIGRRAHATKGLVKPYWARRLKNRDVRASPTPGVCVSRAPVCVCVDPAIDPAVQPRLSRSAANSAALPLLS